MVRQSFAILPSGFPSWWGGEIGGMCTHLTYKQYQVLGGPKTYPYLPHRNGDLVDRETAIANLGSCTESSLSWTQAQYVQMATLGLYLGRRELGS